MRIVMMGTGGFAVPTFRWLLDSEHEVPLLVTRPPRAAAGRRAPPPHPMRVVADQYSLRCVDPASINSPESIALLQQVAPDLLVVCDYGQILSRDVLAIAPLGSINLHASLLPKYRGAAPINWALYDGERETGVTVIHMTPGLDAGPCLTVRQLPINAGSDACQLEADLAELGVDAVGEAIEMLAHWDRSSTLGSVQDLSQVTKAPRLKKDDGLLDWRRTARQLADHVRAFKPWPGTYTEWQREDGTVLRLIIEQVRIVGSEADDPTSPLAPATIAKAVPGVVLSTESQRLLVATGGGVLDVITVKPAGKRALSAGEFLRGYPITAGCRLGLTS